MNPNELLENRAKLIAQARQLAEKAQAENRSMTTEESGQFDTMMNEADELKIKADRLSRLTAAEENLTESRGRQTQHEQADRGHASDEKAETRTIELRASVAGDKRRMTITRDRAVQTHEQAFRKFLVGGATVLTGDESRALQQDSGTGGGYLTAPTQWMGELIMALDNAVFMRQICRVLTPLTSADSLGQPSMDNDPADPIWTSELGTGDEDSTMSFGKRELRPHPAAKRIKISKTLIRKSSVGVESLVQERLAYKFGTMLENAYLNGTGNQQPLGVFTASDNGIPTSRDVSAGNTTTEIRFDGLINAVYDMPGQYRRIGLSWIFHRDAIKQMRKLKDGEGRYIWQQSIVAGTPDTILAYPVYESEYAPNTFTTGLYVGILGNFRYYHIVDALTLTVQTLTELYALTNQNGYIGRIETDGMPVLSDGFRRVKLG